MLNIFCAGHKAAGSSRQHLRMLLSTATPFRLGAQHLAFRRFRPLSTGRPLCNYKHAETLRGRILSLKPADSNLQCTRRWAHSKPQGGISLRNRLSKFWPWSSQGEEERSKSASFSKMVALAKPESKPIAIAIGLLLVSSSVSMSVPFTIGKLIDYFSTSSPVRIYIARNQE